MSKKGFQRKSKTPTKSELIENHGTQLEQTNKMIQGLQQFMFQTNQQIGQHLQQLQRQVDELSNLVRLKQSAVPAQYNDWVVVDLLARSFGEDGVSVSEDYIKELSTLGTSFRLEKEFTFFPELVENLVGKVAGENILVDCVIPENYPVKELHGKKIQLDVSLINLYSPLESNDRLGKLKNQIDAKIAAKQQAEAKAAEEAKTAQATQAAQASETTEVTQPEGQ